MGPYILLAFSFLGAALILTALYYLQRAIKEQHKPDCTCVDCDLYRYEGIPHDH